MPRRPFVDPDEGLISIELNDFAGSMDPPIDLFNQVSSIDIYESVLKPSIYAEVVVVDMIGLLDRLPFRGEERLFIEIDDMMEESPIKNYEFVVSSVESTAIAEDGRSRSYKLCCVSPEHFFAQSQSITKGYDDNISAIIEDILTNQIGTTKEYVTSKTKGSQKLIIPDLSPFQALDFLRRRAVSEDYKSSLFAFFESARGYCFKTFEQMIEEGRDSIGDRIFFLDSDANTNRKDNMTKRSVVGLFSERNINVLEKLAKGGMNTVVNVLDLYEGKYETTEYKYSEEIDSFVFPDRKYEPPHTDTFNQTFSNAKGGFTRFIPIESAKETPWYYDEEAGRKHIYSNQIFQGVTRIQVHGDNQIAAGDMIRVEMLEPHGAEKREDSVTQGGAYFITKVRRMIKPSGMRTKYSLSLEGVRGVYQI